MKIRLNPRPQGSVLVISLIIATLSLATLGSYLLLAANENQAVWRSQTWNACVPVMEAGVEEALTQIYHTGATNLSANNWIRGTDGYYRKTRYVGTNGSYCKIAIQGTNLPVIYSTAYVPAPRSPSQYVVRKVRVTTQSAGSGSGGLNAKGTISLSGGALFDSFDSSLGAYNPTNHGTKAIALSNTNVAGAVNMSGGSIYGMAVTGPGGTVTTSGSAVIGDVAWVSSGGDNTLSPNAKSGWTANDANFQFNDVTPPSTAGWFTSFIPFGTTNIAGFTGLTTDYYVPGISSSGSTKPLLIYGNVVIYCYQTGNNVVNISGSGYIKLMPGSSLTLYTAGNVSVSGGGIINGSGLASDLTIYGLPTCTAVTYSGSAAFIGVVNAPEAAFKFSGGSGAFGSFTANTVIISGSGGVHYDEALGASQSFVVASWNEIQP